MLIRFTGTSGVVYYLQDSTMRSIREINKKESNYDKKCSAILCENEKDGESWHCVGSPDEVFAEINKQQRQQRSDIIEYTRSKCCRQDRRYYAMLVS